MAWFAVDHGFNAKAQSAERRAESGEILKGFCHSARGCEARATLGQPSQLFPTPTGVVSLFRISQLIRIAVCRFLLLRLFEFLLSAFPISAFPPSRGWWFAVDQDFNARAQRRKGAKRKAQSVVRGPVVP